MSAEDRAKFSLQRLMGHAEIVMGLENNIAVTLWSASNAVVLGRYL